MGSLVCWQEGVENWTFSRSTFHRFLHSFLSLHMNPDNLISFLLFFVFSSLGTTWLQNKMSLSYEKGFLNVVCNTVRALSSETKTRHSLKLKVEAWRKKFFKTILATSIAYKCTLRFLSCCKYLWLQSYFSIDKPFKKKTSWFFKVSTYLISHKWDNIFEIPLKSRKMYV